MPASKNTRRSTVWRTVGIILVALCVIAVTVLSTLWFSEEWGLGLANQPGDDTAQSAESGYRVITLTDAMLACQAQADEEFGASLQHITLDRHSSRFDAADNRFKMYFEMDLAASRQASETIPHFLNCFVHGSRGTVVYFASVESQPGDEGQSGVFFGR